MTDCSTFREPMEAPAMKNSTDMTTMPPQERMSPPVSLKNTKIRAKGMAPIRVKKLYMLFFSCFLMRMRRDLAPTTPTSAVTSRRLWPTKKPSESKTISSKPRSPRLKRKRWRKTSTASTESHSSKKSKKEPRETTFLP